MPGGGHVTYTFGDQVFRIASAPGSPAENVSMLITPGQTGHPDRRLNSSSNGQHYVFETGDIDPACAGSFCLAIGPANAPAASTLVTEGGNRIENAEGISAVNNEGNVVVFAASGKGHDRDLFVTRRIPEGWSLAEPITAGSSFAWNDFPSIHPDGTRVVFDCGVVANAGEGGNLCEVGIHGDGFHTVVTADDAPVGVSHRGPLHHAHYAHDGSIVFEADWDGERIWRKNGPMVKNLSTQVFGNDNSPCVLPDGRIVSLWTNGPQNPANNHEIKMMGLEGTAPKMLLTGIDVSDIGLGCGN